MILLIGTCLLNQSGKPGRPSYAIPKEILEDLREMGYSWERISKTLGVSRWTLRRRVEEFDISKSVITYSKLSDVEIDSIILQFINQHGRNVGQTFLEGYFRAKGVRIQRRRIREGLLRADPTNTMLRWGVITSRRKYYVPWPNSLWHLDGHHSLIRWKFVVHGCIDGYSRRMMFLKCSHNNLAQTVLDLFLDCIKHDGDRWPSRIRVDYGVENVLVCDAMVECRGEGRGSFIAGSSTHNQRIERSWRDIFRCVLHYFYYLFYAMEDSGVFNLEDPVDIFTMHVVFLPRINEALTEYVEMFNNHKLRTEKNLTPNQIWFNGMLDETNPLANGEIDDNIDDPVVYGIDPRGPSPFEDTNNNVVVPEILIPYDDKESIHLYVLSNMNPLSDSTCMGIDLFERARNLVKEKITSDGNI